MLGAEGPRYISTVGVCPLGFGRSTRHGTLQQSVLCGRSLRAGHAKADDVVDAWRQETRLERAASLRADRGLVKNPGTERRRPLTSPEDLGVCRNTSVARQRSDCKSTGKRLLRGVFVIKRVRLRAPKPPLGSSSNAPYHRRTSEKVRGGCAWLWFVRSRVMMADWPKSVMVEPPANNERGLLRENSKRKERRVGR